MTRVTLATYNIHYGVGADDVCDINRIADVIRGADIVGLQEVDVHWDRSGNHDQPERLSQLLPDHYPAWGPNVDVLKSGEAARNGAAALRRQFGNMIFSRFPVVSIRNHMLPRYGAASAMDMQRGALETVIQLPSRTVRVYCTHLCHLSDAQRKIQADCLVGICARAPLEGAVISGVHPADPSWSSERPLPDMPEEAVILADLNADSKSAAYAAIVGDTVPRFGTLTRREGLVDAWAAASESGVAAVSGAATAGSEPGATRYASFEKKIGRRIDYCFVTTKLSRFIRSASVLTDAPGSDHRPVFVTMDIP
jgi:endonuclease/exonuclease/phosphatase family metal-dependent hydrolase